MLELRHTAAIQDQATSRSPFPRTTRTGRQVPWEKRGVPEVRFVATETGHFAITASRLRPQGCLVSWAVVTLEEALSSLDSHHNLQPSAHDFSCILRKHRKEGNPDSLLRLFAHIRRLKLDTDPSLGNQLVPLLVAAGHMQAAQQLFDSLECPSRSSCDSLITGYVKCGQPHLALSLYRKIQHNGSMHPSGRTFVALVKACTKLKDLELGSQIHACVAAKGLLQSDRFLGSALVDMYAKCGSLAKAEDLFNKLPARDAVSWNALIAGYAKHGHGEELLRCYDQMQLEGLAPTAVTFICILKACGTLEDLKRLIEVHEEVIRHGFEKDLHVGSILVDLYAKHGLLDKAEELFHKLPIRNVFSWTALIKGCTEHDRAEEALKFFDQMQREGVSPDGVAFLCGLKACIKVGDLYKGQELHFEISRTGLERDLLVGCTLVDMYSKFGLLEKAREVFKTLPARDVSLWNSLMGGLIDHEFGEEALQCYEQMQADCISPNAVSFVLALKACASLVNIQKGSEIHAEIFKRKLDKDLLVGSSLVDMYAKCGALVRAQEVFDRLLARDVVSWTALISGYAEHGDCQQALYCYNKMHREGLFPNAITFACILKACGIEGAIDKGQEIHAKVARSGLLDKEPMVGNALIDMYAKCGLPVKAQQVFDVHATQDVVSWNTLISGYAQLGESCTVARMVNRMAEEGREPNTITFVSILNACSHAGLTDLGLMYFDSMSNDYGIIPTIEHHTCVVDLLGRAGQIERALYIIDAMQLDPDPVMWHTLLGACQKWGDVELGRRAFEQAVCLNGLDATAYVSMSNIYYDDNSDS